MSFLDRFKRTSTDVAPPRAEPMVSMPASPEVVEETKFSAAGPIISRHFVGKAVWTPRNYETLSREAYFINSISFRCVNMIAGGFANVPLLLFRGKNEVTEHPLLDLLNRPSPTMGGRALRQRFAAFLLLTGNGYLETVGPKSKAPRELWVPRSDRMKVVAGGQGVPSAFEYGHLGNKKRWQVNPVTGQADILHVKEFNPIDDWYGMSRLEAAVYGVDRHNAASDHNKALLDNGARPSGALVFKPMADTGPGSTVTAPQAVINKAERELQKRHGGSENAGKPMVLSGAVDWVEMGISPKDMDFDKGKDDAARDICIAWGVPHMLLVKGQSTYNNVSEAKLELYEDNVMPFTETVIDELNVFLAPRFGDGFQLRPDWDSVPALEPRRVSRRQSVTDLLDKGVIDDDEAREMLGYGPRTDDMVKKVDATVLTALIAAVESVGIGPLARYMRSVRLVSPGTTDEQILNEALSLIEEGDEEDEDEDEEDETNNAGEQDDEE